MSSFLLYTVFLGFHAGQLSTTCAACHPTPPPAHAAPPPRTASCSRRELPTRGMAPPPHARTLRECAAHAACPPSCLPSSRHAAFALATAPAPALVLVLALGGRRYAELQRAVGASERLLGLLHRTPALPLTGGVTLPRSSWRGAVELKGVTFAYPANPEVSVLREASLSIGAGEHVAIIGQSGCGKSTIAALLCALYAPGAGRTTLDGHDVLSLDAAHLRGELVACVPQEPPLLAGTLRDNIAIGRPGATEEELRAAAAAAGCDFAAADWEREVTKDAAPTLGLSPSLT